MPKDFTNCVNAGGKVVTKNLKGNKYIHICYDKKGDAHSGEVKTRKKKKTKSAKEQIENSKVIVADLKRLKKHFDEKRN
jgi:hypothetical protein